MDSRNDLDNNRFKLCFLSAFGTYLADTLSYPLKLLATVIKSKHDTTSIYKTCCTLIRENGATSFFRGWNTVLLTSFVPNFTYFYVYEGMSNSVLKNIGKLKDSLHVPLISSFCAELVCVLIFVPFDTVQTRMQLNSPQYQYQSILGGIRNIVKTEGISRLFSASYLYILQLLIFTPMQFTFYEWLKMNQINESADKGSLMYTDSLKFTFISTSFSAIITNPINTLVVRYQLTDFSSIEGKSLSGWRLMRDSFRSYGIKDLNRGMCIRLLQTNVNAAVFLPIYEMTRQFYDEDREK
jgi:hypothetical protein